MRRQVSNARPWLGLFVLLASAALLASPPTPQGVLFELGRPGGPPSYLFGTMHLDHPKVLVYLDRVEPLLQQVDRLVMEAVPDGSAMLRAASAGFYADDRSLKDDLEPPFYRRVAELMAERGVQEPILRRMKPWHVAVTLSIPGGEQTAFLDLRLFNRAEELGLPVQGLESIDEQLALFDGLNTDMQVVLLQQAVAQQPDLSQLLERMIDAYHRGDLAYLEKVSIEQQAGFDPRLVSWFSETMIEQRNRVMLERLRGLLNDGRSLIAVGALHLPGPTGLLQGLEAEGYRIRALD